ncbi:hypothetical protein DFAR_3870002 [Desulfarculales bacterium]
MAKSNAIKNQVRRLLQAPDLVFALGFWSEPLAGMKVKPLLRALLSGLSTPGEDERWQAVSFLGLLLARLTGDNLDILCELLRRLM